MSHYDYLNRTLPDFFEKVGVSFDGNAGIVGAHGDKCYCYRGAWKKAGIPFAQGVAIFLLSYCNPYAEETRQTDEGWVKVEQWVIDNWERFSPHLPPIIEEDDCDGYY